MSSIFTGVDYIPLLLDGTFSPVIDASQQSSFSLELINDSVLEDTERLFLRLSSSDPAVNVDSEADQINLTIRDNDGIASLIVRLKSNCYNIISFSCSSLP